MLRSQGGDGHSRRRTSYLTDVYLMGWDLVPGGGVEPPRPEGRRILSPLRLPVPPSRLLRGIHRLAQQLAAGKILRQPHRSCNDTASSRSKPAHTAPRLLSKTRGTPFRD